MEEVGIELLTFFLHVNVSPNYGGVQLSRQNQKPHSKNKIPHSKTENLTAKTKTSQRNQK